jgi:hypothetical protein
MSDQDLQTALSNTAPGAQPQYTPIFKAASEDFFRGGYQDAYDKLAGLLKNDPSAINDPRIRYLRKRVAVTLNME